MTVDAKFARLLENLKVEDPWLPPNTWESIPSESGLHSSSSSSHQPNQPLSHLSTLSVSSSSSSKLTYAFHCNAMRLAIGKPSQFATIAFLLFQALLFHRYISMHFELNSADIYGPRNQVW